MGCAMAGWLVSTTTDRYSLGRAAKDGASPVSSSPSPNRDHRFLPCLRALEDRLAESSLIDNYEIVRLWSGGLGSTLARTPRRQQDPMGDEWHMHLVSVPISGENGIFGKQRTTPATSRISQSLTATRSATGTTRQRSRRRRKQTASRTSALPVGLRGFSRPGMKSGTATVPGLRVPAT